MRTLQHALIIVVLAIIWALMVWLAMPECPNGGYPVGRACVAVPLP